VLRSGRFAAASRMSFFFCHDQSIENLGERQKIRPFQRGQAAIVDCDLLRRWHERFDKHYRIDLCRSAVFVILAHYTYRQVTNIAVYNVYGNERRVKRRKRDLVINNTAHAHCRPRYHCYNLQWRRDHSITCSRSWAAISTSASRTRL